GRGRTLELDESFYGGLYGRSRFAGNAKVAYRIPKFDLEFYARWNWRSAYRFGDTNNNGVSDIFDEKSNAFHQVNLSIQWSKKRFSALMSIRNLLNNTDPVFLPYDPGTNFLLTLNFNLSKQVKP
ncbi:MAG: hypothetical protein ACPF8V_04560, partial [Luteibaculum sp.]